MLLRSDPAELVCCAPFCVPTAYLLHDDECCCPKEIDCTSISRKCQVDADCGDDPAMRCCTENDCGVGVCVACSDLEQCVASKCPGKLQQMVLEQAHFAFSRSNHRTEHNGQHYSA